MHKGKTGKHFPLFIYFIFVSLSTLILPLTLASVSAAPGPTFNTLKEELLFRHQLAAGAGAGAGFPLPQYPPGPAPALLPALAQVAAAPPPAEAAHTSEASLSPDSKETGGSAGEASPGQAETSSDTSEKRRSRKQKPRKMIFGEGEREENTETEEEGSSVSRDRSPRERHGSASSYSRDEVQQEPEDLTIARKKEAEPGAGLLAYRAATAISEFGLRRDTADLEEAGYPFTAAARTAKPPQRNRSEGSEGSLSASDPLSAHSTPNAKFRADELEDERRASNDEDERGVSPPMAHPSMYNQLFGGQAAAILSGHAAAVPLQVGVAPGLARDYREKEAELLHSALVQHKEISQQ